MNGKANVFDDAFLDARRRQLLALRAELSATRQAQSAEEEEVKTQARNEAHEYEEDAQKLTTLELDGVLTARSDARLADVERALRKLEEGTYGLSEASGTAIPAERLVAKPEALYTVEEQAVRDTQR